MGLIRSLSTSIKTALGDQWKEFFYCESLSNDVLAAKGVKRIGKKSSNKKGTDNIISSGSGIAVADGQCMIIVEQGKVVEFCAEPGEYTWDASTEPSIFTGGLGKGIADLFATIGRRFTYGGDAGKDQRVYYFNLKEIVDNRFGTLNPIPFRVVDRNIGLDVDVSVRCSGVYSFKMTNPLLFYTSISGNMAEVYTRSQLEVQMKTEFVSALQPAFARISVKQVRPNELPAYSEEIAELMNEALDKKWKGIRGIEVVSVAFNPITIPEEDAKMIKELQRKAVMRDPGMAAATLVEAQSEAMVGAANNSAGAMHGFFGMGMAMNQAGGGINAQTLYNMNAEQEKARQTAPPTPTPDDTKSTWKCVCGAENTGKFCVECGKPKPAGSWKCACGAENMGKFCPECGAKKPADAPLYRCDKCGFVPKDPKNPPKFCPECGDPFDTNDIT